MSEHDVLELTRVGLNGFAVEGVVVQDCVLGYLVGAGTEVLAFEPNGERP
jgi:hypothetical protein